MKTYSAGGWAVRAIAFIAIAAVALLFQADREARTQRELAAQLPAGLGGFADERMVEALAFLDPAAAFARARALLRQRPTDAHNLGLYALAAVEAGADGEAAEALTAAARRGWRDPYTQVTITGSAIAQKQWEIAAQRVDALARMRREQATIFAALRFMLADPEGRAEIARRLPTSEPFAAVLAEFTRANADMGAQVAETLRLTHSAQPPVSCANYSRAVRALLAQGQAIAALEGWPRRCASNGSKAVDFAFDDNEGDPFSWTYPPGAGVSIREGDAPGAIDIRNRDLLRRQVAYRYLALPPGSYTLRFERSAGAAGTAGTGPRADLNVLLRCDRSGGNAAGALAEGTYQQPLSFAIGADCPVQYLSLAVSQGRADNVRITID